MFLHATRIRLSISLLILISSSATSRLALAADTNRAPETRPAESATKTQPVRRSAIAVDAAEHDFGQVRSGEKVEHRFRITNKEEEKGTSLILDYWGH